MIVAGEASGDTHAAKLVRAIHEAEPETEFHFFGAAGPKMRDEGVDAVIRSDQLSIVGLVEIGTALPMFLKAFYNLKKAALVRKPDAVILVDFPEFNLKLAKALKLKGFHIIYYISPQLWAWRRYRIGTIKKYVDLMLTILPFEKDWYARNGVENVEYVGSPLAREVHPSIRKEEFCRVHGLDSKRPIISLLPGSRHKEIVRILPIMLAAASEISAKNRDIQFLIAAASRRNVADIKAAIDNADDLLLPAFIRVTEAVTYDALNSSDAAAVTSGTATLEAGILGVPMAVVYKVSTLNYRIFEPMIDVPHYGLINLIAEKRVAKEFIHADFTAQMLSNELLRLLEPDVNSAMRKELKIATEKLGHGGASKRAAAAILDHLLI
jgi:lipid-A-disaccharide synthase